MKIVALFITINYRPFALFNHRQRWVWTPPRIARRPYYQPRRRARHPPRARSPIIGAMSDAIAGAIVIGLEADCTDIANGTIVAITVITITRI